MKKISIVGAGQVGQAVTHMLAKENFCGRIALLVLEDARHAVGGGDALDDFRHAVDRHLLRLGPERSTA